jgi:periplasmic protein TonB
MAAAALSGPAMMGDPGSPRRRKRSPVTFGRVLVVIGVSLAIALAYMMAGRVTVSDRPNEMKTTTVILPPPPPPPPPPETKPVEKPPEPTIAPPIEQPVDTPPPPEAINDPVQGDSALTAREGAGPSNYGLAVGNGGGTRIGGRPGGGGGGDAHRAYAGVAQACIQRAAQGDRELTRGRYNAALTVTMAGDGRIADARVSGVDDRRAAQIRGLLAGIQCQTPPAGLPTMRLQLSARAGG